MLRQRRYSIQRGSYPVDDIMDESFFKWDGSHLGSLPPDRLIEEDQVKVGRVLKRCLLNISGKTTKCLVKPIDSLLPVIFDEIKPIFGLTKAGTHSFRHGGKLMIAYKPILVRGQIYSETTLDMVTSSLAKRIEGQVRLNLAFREIFGITDTHDKSLILRYDNPITAFHLDDLPTVISFLEPGTVAGGEDSYKPILPQTMIDRWFNRDSEDTSLERTILSLLCLNRESPETTLGYYRPQIEGVIEKIDKSLITYLDLFFDRLNSYLPY